MPIRRILAVLSLTLASAPAVAQPAPIPAPAPPGAAPAPVPTPAPTPAAPEPAAQCVPACRVGFVCIAGNCVSACNPPCATGEHCTEHGDCVADQPAAAPAPAPAPTAAPPAPGAASTVPAAPGASSDPGAPPFSLAPPPPPESEGARQHEPESHWHHGFYLRFATGIGLESISADYEDTTTKGSASVAALAAMGEFALGGSPTPGLVIGVGSYAALFTSKPKYSVKVQDKIEGIPLTQELELDTSALSLLGPFVDIYPKADSAFHLQAGIGYASIGVEDPDDTDTISLTGFGAMAGIGAEGHVADSWGIGAMGRVLLAWPTGEDPSDSTEKYSSFIVAPGVLLTFTYY